MRITAAFILNFLCCCCCCFCSGRKERNLVFEESSIFKFVAGFSVPVDVGTEGKSLGWSTSVQAVYKLPDNVSYYEPYQVMSGKTMRNSLNGQFLHAAAKKMFQKSGLSREGIQRFLCELFEMQSNGRGGLLGDVLHVVLPQLFKSSAIALAKCSGKSRKVSRGNWD